MVSAPAWAGVEWDSDQVAEDQPLAEIREMETNRPLRISGRYLVAVERLQDDGTAGGRVIAVSAEIAPPELALAFDQNPPEMMGAWLAFLGGLPGEIAEVEVSWNLPRKGRRAKHSPRAVVRLVEVRRGAAGRVAPRCPVFTACGGCQLQHLAYSAQLEWKRERVATAVRSAGLSEVPVLPTIGSRIPWNYRNQMRFSINREGQPGLTSHHSRRILPLSNCPIAHSRINEALAILSEHPLRPPQLLVRYGESNHHLLLQPVPEQVELRHELEGTGMELRESDMEEALGGVSFRIRPSSFFQTNTDQANRMMELVLERIPPGEQCTWVDAYCGVGTFARLMAGIVGSVIAIEESSSAVLAARANLAAAPNVELLQGKVEEVLPQLCRRLARVDGLVIDPPRAGCQRPVLEALAAAPLPRVIYVSCNPDTLARDLAYLCRERNAYGVTSIQPLDMFPQTAHIESITLLEAR